MSKKGILDQKWLKGVGFDWTNSETIMIIGIAYIILHVVGYV
jgi:hypothetical protein